MKDYTRELKKLYSKDFNRIKRDNQYKVNKWSRLEKLQHYTDKYRHYAKVWEARLNLATTKCQKEICKQMLSNIVYYYNININGL